MRRKQHTSSMSAMPSLSICSMLAEMEACTESMSACPAALQCTHRKTAAAGSST